MLNTIIDQQWLDKFAPCSEGKEWYLEKYKEPIKAEQLINDLLRADEIEKIGWVNWLLPRLFTKNQCVQYAIYAAELVLHLFESKYPDDKRPRLAIEAAKKCLDCLGNAAETARAARAAGDAAWAAGAAARDAGAAWAAWAAGDAARAAAWAAEAAARDAARDAAWAAGDAARAARAAWAAWAARAAAYKETLIKIINYGRSILENVEKSL